MNQCAFSSATAANDAVDFARFDFEVDIFQRVHSAIFRRVIFINIVKFNHYFSRFSRLGLVAYPQAESNRCNDFSSKLLIRQVIVPLGHFLN